MPLLIFAIVVFALTFLYHRKKVNHPATAIQRGLVMTIALSIVLLLALLIAERFGFMGV